MSGQLVGEVLAASDQLRALGLSERGFHALIAIAEKANTETRRASVPLMHICRVLYGDVEQKRRTAERAISDLKAVNVITVVKRGFNNAHGRTAAPIYQINLLTVPVTGDGNEPTAPASPVSETVGTVPAKTGDRSRQTDDRSRHSYGVLNVFPNVFSNERAQPRAEVTEQVDLANRAKALVAGTLDGRVKEVRSSILRQAAALLARGIADDDVRAGLLEWVTRPGAKPGLLPYLVDDVVTSRNAVVAPDRLTARLSTADRAFAEAQALKDATVKELR